MAFSIERAGSPKSLVGAFNPQALLGHICLICISHFKENSSFSVKKEVTPQLLAPRLELHYLVMYGPICGGHPERLSPFREFFFPLLPPSIHLPHNEIQEHLLSPRLSKQAGSKPSQAFSQLAGLSVSKALRRSCHHSSKCHDCPRASGFSHIWYSQRC